MKIMALPIGKYNGVKWVFRWTKYGKDLLHPGNIINCSRFNLVSSSHSWDNGIFE